MVWVPYGQFGKKWGKLDSDFKKRGWVYLDYCSLFIQTKGTQKIYWGLEKATKLGSDGVQPHGNIQMKENGLI